MQKDFNSMQQQAINQAREMKSRAINQTPFCKNACPIKNILSPITGEADNDVMLLMGLLLLLCADGGDKLLMFALLYIMT